MPSTYSRLTATRSLFRLIITFSLIGGVGCGVASFLQGEHTLSVMLPYLLAGLTLVLLAGMSAVFVTLLFKIEANSYRVHELLMETRATHDKQMDMLTTIKDNSQISDAAKSITHRDLERDALRKAIREDILREDWEAAYSLIEEMESRFGYRLEAYNYRREVDEFRARVIEEKLQISMRHLRELQNNKQWDQAQAESERLLKLAPKDDRVAAVIAQLQVSKDRHKTQLLAQWHEAVDNKDLDRSIALLKEIDPYLTHEEALQLQDSARSIFKAKLLDLGVLFRTAVKEKNWSDAVRIGDDIRNEYPNSLMAKEVGESMEALHAKASQASPAGSH